MNLRSLHYFREVARKESITQAAQELHIAQPALSKQIRRLEAELGTRLFDRNSHGIRLTESGKMLLRYTERILGDWGQVQHGIRALERLEAGQLRLAVFPTVWYVLRPRLAQFVQEHPAIDVAVENGLSEVVIDWVLEHHVEAGVVVMPISHPRLAETPLYTEEFVLLVPPGHRWHGQDEVPVAELDNHPIIVPTLNRWYREFVLPMFRQHNVRLETRLAAHNYETVLYLVRAGLGAGLIPLTACVAWESEHAGEKVVRITPSLQRHFAWIERSDGVRSPACHTFFREFALALRQQSTLPCLLKNSAN
jgi:DNA-binding transcriptional LysR family regulator